MDPVTGFMRDGYCRYTEEDRGRHHVCAVVTQDFLEFSKQRGNNLIEPRPDLQFPGLEPGDRWCLCVPRWIEALQGDCAPPVVLEATSKATLSKVSLETLRKHEYQAEAMD